VNADFNWWLLIVGLVLGAALTWLVMAESTRRDADLDETERRGEALWIASMLSTPDRPADATDVEEVLRLHREYLAAPPPDEPGETGSTPSDDEASVDDIVAARSTPPRGQETTDALTLAPPLRPERSDVREPAAASPEDR
jgi:hypothetical protein